MDLAGSLESRARLCLPEALASQGGLIDSEKVILGVFFVDELSEPVSSREMYFGLGGNEFCNAAGYQYMLDCLSSYGFLEEVEGGGLDSGVLYRKGSLLERHASVEM